MAERIEKQVEDFLKEKENKIIFVSLINLAFCINIIMVDLLKLRGVLKEIDLEPFPKNLKGRLVAINHQDGNEWFFFYRRCFKKRYFVFPWFILKNLPYSWADRENFIRSSLTEKLKGILVAVDRNNNGTARVSFKQSFAAIKKAGLLGFFEGHRTSKCENLLFSQKGKSLGKLSESLGIFAIEGIFIKLGWMEFPGASFHSLSSDGKFRVRWFLLWYWRTFWKKNGKINIVWGETVIFEMPESVDKKELRRVATRHFEKQMLELADKA